MARYKPVDDGEKKPITASSLKKLLGIFRFVIPYRINFIIGLVALVFTSATVFTFPYLAGSYWMWHRARGFVLTSINQIARPSWEFWWLRVSSLL